ncbi:MAG: peptidylprolyl isomerase, partial [Verrucomicrobiota bacterium]
MKNILRTSLAALVALALSAIAQSNLTKTTEPVFANPVVAKGKGFEIKQKDVEDAFIDYKANAAARGQSISEPERDDVEAKLLERLVVTKVLISRANTDDKKKAEELTTKLVDSAKKQFPSEEMFEQQLKATGITFAQFRTRANEQAIAEMVIERELKPSIKVPESAAKKFYDENPARFERPETVRAAHILISTVDKATQQPLPAAKKKEKEQLAKSVRERAKKGEDFGKLAKEFSEDPGSKDKGGEYVFARGEMVPEFETAAFSMQTNQVSDLVETRYGYHIIKLLQKIPPEKLEFAKVLPDLTEGLTQQELQKQLPDYFGKIKKEANAEILAPKKTTDGPSAPEKKP